MAFNVNASSRGQYQYQPRQPKIVEQNFDYFLVLDFEATCEKDIQIKPQEIIEFPVMKVNAKTFEVESTFHQFVKPAHNPLLSDFCKELTTITQEEVDSGKPFEEVLKDFEQWIEEDVGNSRFLFITCGDWDLNKMLPMQCELSKVQVPPYCKSWLNIKRPYRAITKDESRGMMPMIRRLNLEHVGILHRGIGYFRFYSSFSNARGIVVGDTFLLSQCMLICTLVNTICKRPPSTIWLELYLYDDCRNIVNILRAIAERGWIFKPSGGNRY